jgi:diguanylate cyclase (GGDEF)-like protein
MFEIIIDLLFICFEGNTTIEKGFLYLLKTMEFLLNPLLPFYIAKLFNSSIKSTRYLWIKRFQILLICANICLHLSALLGFYVFKIDENYMYHRTNLTFIYVFILAASMILMIYSMHIFSDRAQNSSKLTLIGLLLLLTTGLALRAFFPNTNFDWLCISASFFVIDIYYVNVSLKLDPLTQLLNRQVYLSVLEEIKLSTLVIMIDANGLKYVNDTFGHECGDKTLQAIAKCIHKSYSEYGWCFRIGGDEFVVILKPEAFQTLVDKTPRSDMYAMAENLMKKLDEKIVNYSEKDTGGYLFNGVSQGYGIYYSPQEYPSILERNTIEDVVKIADEMMYARKAEYKKNHPDYNSSDKQGAEKSIKRLHAPQES